MRAPASLHRLRRADEIQAGRETEAATGTGTARGIETEAETATGAVIGTETETGIEGRALTAEAGNGRGRRSTVMGVEMRDDTNSDGRLCLAVPGSSFGFGCVGTAKAVCIWRAATENQALRSDYTPIRRRPCLQTGRRAVKSNANPE